MRKTDMKRIENSLVMLIILLLSTINANSQPNTVGLIFNEGEAYDAYTLFSPAGNKMIYLIDNNGSIVHQWESTHNPGNAVYLHEDGSLYRAGQVENEHIQAGGAGGIIEKFNWEGELIWSYTISDMQYRAHHDFQVMPNGNILIMVWEEIALEEVLANGRNPELLSDEKLWPELITEIEPTGHSSGNIVWEWRAWDHLIQDFDQEKTNYGIVADHPGKIDLNFIEDEKIDADWHHANAISYNPDLDQIMISVLKFDEIWVIDHNTTMAEAKGEKGDLLFRWGNPMTYGAGTADDQMLFNMHNPHWIPKGLPDEGKILIFNNGRDRPNEEFTTLVKIDPTIMEDGSYMKSDENRFLPISFDYEYMAEVPANFFSWYISGVQQLPNGHLLINDGAHGTFFEIDKNEEEVWRYINPVTKQGITYQGEFPVDSNDKPTNPVFRALKYAKDFPAFVGKDLIPGVQIELDRILAINESISLKPIIYPNPATTKININSSVPNNEIKLLDTSGKTVYEGSFHTKEIEIYAHHLPRGIYLILFNQEFLGRIHLK
jgi:hypothetical protein